MIKPARSVKLHPMPSKAKRATRSATESAATAIPTAEYRARRETVLKALGKSAAIVLAGEGSPPLLGRWRAQQHFTYLTGLTDEPGGAVLFDPTNENTKRRIVLFLKPLNPEMERWDGYRDPIASALKEKLGFATVLRTNQLPMFLTAAARRAKRVACLHAFGVYPAPASPDLELFKELSSRIPGLAIEDQTQLLPRMRAVKSAAELALMNKAVECTAAGFAEILKYVRPGLTEGQLEHALESAYRMAGADGVAYNSIVGSGLMGTVLHYMANNRPLEDGDLIVIDSAARYRGYASDVTRTLPASGKFADAQRQLYQTVLDAQLAAIAACRPGRTMTEVDQAARDVIEKAGLGDAFIHSIGHQLGLEVHDVTPDGPLAPGMVVTIEPGVYLPEAKTGVRIEDEILITRAGPKNLTAMIPKTIAEIEAAMAR